MLRLERCCCQDPLYAEMALDATTLQSLLGCQHVRGYEVLMSTGIREVAPAYMILSFYREDDCDVEILHMAVHPDLRRNGIGRAMVQSARSMLAKSSDILGCHPRDGGGDLECLLHATGFQEEIRTNCVGNPFSVFRAAGWAIDGTEVIRSLHSGDCRTVLRAGATCDVR